MTISVIIPCYKGERHIANCLENLLGQKYKMKLEIIVVIDGDIDNSASIARRYSVKVIVLEKNQGISTARNVGFDAATGDYVHFMDVDDRVNEDFYANMAVALYDTGADIACCGIFSERKAYKSQVFHKIKVYTSTRGKLSVTWVVKWGFVWRYIFKRSFLIEHNLRFEVGRFIEDRYFSFTALYYADIVVTVPGAVYTYCDTAGSVLNIKDKQWKRKMKNDYSHSDDIIKEFAREHSISAPGLPWDPGIILYIIRKYCIIIASSIFWNYYHNPLSDRYIKY